MRAEFVVPIIAKPPTANDRMHWGIRSQLVSSIRNTVAIAARSERNRLGMPEAKGPRHVSLMALRPGAEGSHVLDDDNLAAWLKPVVDGLVRAGWLVDDTPKWATFSRAQARGARREVEVIVTEAAS